MSDVSSNLERVSKVKNYPTSPQRELFIDIRDHHADHYQVVFNRLSKHPLFQNVLAQIWTIAVNI